MPGKTKFKNPPLGFASSDRFHHFPDSSLVVGGKRETILKMACHYCPRCFLIALVFFWCAYTTLNWESFLIRLVGQLNDLLYCLCTRLFKKQQWGISYEIINSCFCLKVNERCLTDYKVSVHCWVYYKTHIYIIYTINTPYTIAACAQSMLRALRGALSLSLVYCVQSQRRLSPILAWAQWDLVNKNFFTTQLSGGREARFANDAWIANKKGKISLGES